MYRRAVDAIETELREAQAAVEAIRAARVRRQKAVQAAISAGWTKYRIAQTLGVSAPTVDSILDATKTTTP